MAAQTNFSNNGVHLQYNLKSKQINDEPAILNNTNSNLVPSTSNSCQYIDFSAEQSIIKIVLENVHTNRTNLFL